MKGQPYYWCNCLHFAPAGNFHQKGQGEDYTQSKPLREKLIDLKSKDETNGLGQSFSDFSNIFALGKGLR